MHASLVPQHRIRKALASGMGPYMPPLKSVQVVSSGMEVLDEASPPMPIEPTEKVLPAAYHQEAP